MSRFHFCPDLFEVRARVLEELSERGYCWLSHFSAVDPLHETYGIEVCGIHDREDAVAIQRILRKLFPGWSCG